MDFGKTSSLTVDDKMNLSLDEIIISDLKDKIAGLNEDMESMACMNRYLMNKNDTLKNLLKEKEEIVVLNDWIVHLDSNGKEYVRGLKNIFDDRIWETSFIREKICMSSYLLVITESESLYCLPYRESNH